MAGYAADSQYADYLHPLPSECEQFDDECDVRVGSLAIVKANTVLMLVFGDNAAIRYANIILVLTLRITSCSRMMLMQKLSMKGNHGVRRPNRCVSVGVVVKCRIVASHTTAILCKSLKYEKYVPNIE